MGRPSPPPTTASGKNNGKGQQGQETQNVPECCSNCFHFPFLLVDNFPSIDAIMRYAYRKTILLACRTPPVSFPCTCTLTLGWISVDMPPMNSVEPSVCTALPSRSKERLFSVPLLSFVTRPSRSTKGLSVQSVLATNDLTLDAVIMPLTGCVSVVWTCTYIPFDGPAGRPWTASGV